MIQENNVLSFLTCVDVLSLRLTSTTLLAWTREEYLGETVTLVRQLPQWRICFPNATNLYVHRKAVGVEPQTTMLKMQRVVIVDDANTPLGSRCSIAKFLRQIHWSVKDLQILNVHSIPVVAWNKLSFGNLQRLTFYNCSAELNTPLKMPPSLKGLVVLSPQHTDFPMPPLDLSRCHNLESLDVDAEACRLHPSNFSSLGRLRSLTIKGQNRVTDECFGNLSSLTDLTILDHHEWSPLSVHGVARVAPRLVTFTFVGSSRTGILNSIPLMAPSLTSLHFRPEFATRREANEFKLDLSSFHNLRTVIYTDWYYPLPVTVNPTTVTRVKIEKRKLGPQEMLFY